MYSKCVQYTLLAVLNTVHVVFSSLTDITCAHTEHRSKNLLFIYIYLALGLWEVRFVPILTAVAVFDK